MIIIPISRGTATSLVAIAVLAAALMAAVCLGDPALSPPRALQALVQVEDPRHVTVWESRSPRVLLGALAGSALGACGLLLQDALRNPIAGPELLGVSSGAAVVTAAVVVLGLGVPTSLLPLLALLGALAVGAAVLLSIGRTPGTERVALVGAAISAACGGLVVAIVGLGTEGNVVTLMRYLLGSLAAHGWDQLAAVAPWLLTGLAAAALLRRRVEALTLGDETAAGLGVDVARTRLAAIAVAAVLAAGVASACGPIAFVALLAPHLARRVTGVASTRRVFWPTVLLGALLLVLADLASRTLLYPVEMPVGIATTLIGVPALVVTMRGRR